jgi:hypothetical protein
MNYSNRKTSKKKKAISLDCRKEGALALILALGMVVSSAMGEEYVVDGVQATSSGSAEEGPSGDWGLAEEEAASFTKAGDEAIDDNDDSIAKLTDNTEGNPKYSSFDKVWEDMDRWLEGDLQDEPLVSDYPPAPAVLDVLLSGSAWDTSNPYELAPFSLIYGVDPDSPLPWVNLNTIDVIFDRNVDVAVNSMTLTGVNVANYSFSGFSYDPTTFTATWTVDSRIGVDKLLINIAGEASDASPVRAAGAGPLLGVDFDRCFSCLPGDATRDASVDDYDLDELGVRWLSYLGGSSYDPFVDFNGDGSINSADLNTLALGYGTISLPPGSPGPCSAFATDDFGDAPDPMYPTLLANNGARHTSGTGPHLGVSVDAESDGQPNATATGDDIAGWTADDEVHAQSGCVPGMPGTQQSLTNDSTHSVGLV